MKKPKYENRTGKEEPKTTHAHRIEQGAMQEERASWTLKYNNIHSNGNWRKWLIIGGTIFVVSAVLPNVCVAAPIVLTLTLNFDSLLLLFNM